MFTGIVTAIGTIAAVTSDQDVRRLAIAAPGFAHGPVGASVACGGICLTVTAALPNGFTVDLGPETLRVTTAERWRPGDRINLEPSLRLGDALDGHLVTGHVDGIATIVERVDYGTTVALTFAAPAELARFVAVKGSVCLDGTSLTVNSVDDVRFGCHLIPHTLAVTTWGERRVGDAVNIEVDIMARYAARLMATKA